MRRSAFAAPLLVVLGRLLQGFSAGVELGGVSVYLSEMATPGHKGFYVSWQSASQQVAVIVAALLGYAIANAYVAGGGGGLGLAHPLLHRLPDRPVHLRDPPLAAGDRGVPGAQGTIRRRARSSRSLAENWALVLAGMRWSS